MNRTQFAQALKIARKKQRLGRPCDFIPLAKFAYFRDEDFKTINTTIEEVAELVLWLSHPQTNKLKKSFEYPKIKDVAFNKFRIQ